MLLYIECKGNKKKFLGTEHHLKRGVGELLHAENN